MQEEAGRPPWRQVRSDRVMSGAPRSGRAGEPGGLVGAHDDFADAPEDFAAEPGEAAAHAGPLRRRRIRVLLGVAGAVLAVDAISKAIVVAVLSGHPPVRTLGGLLTFQVMRNPGAAFNIGMSMTVVFTVIAVGVIVFILRTARRLRSMPWAITLGLLLGGAMGNLVDRLVRAPSPLRGYVVDWIELPHWPVFNLADSAIVCGGAIAILLSVRGMRIDGTRESSGAEGISERR